MASRKIRDEVMMMTISVNSDPAQQAIYELRKENVQYNSTIEELIKKKDVLKKRNKENAAEWDALTASIKENEAKVKSNIDRIEDLRRAMDVNKMTMSQLKKEAQLLQRQLGEIVPGSNIKQQKELEERLIAVRSRMAEVNTSAKSTSLSFSNLAERFNHYSGIVTAVVAVLVGFGISVQNIIDRNNKMADAMSGVEKNVGMTRKEVEELTRSFSDLDTRTSKLDLLKIATGGGRMGVAKDEIRGFVEVADKAIVALGDSWQQTPDKIAESLGKVTTLYSQTKDLPIADGINAVGSALNELAADGAASEQNINDFATRVGALPEKLKPTIADALGLGAAFEESGIDAERSGTAYANFVKIAANNVDKFAKVMNLPIAKVKELINTNPTEFFLQFSEGLKGMDATDLAKTLDYLKINDQYVSSILGVASEKNERFRETLELSNESMSKATSLTDEFNKVNNNAAGIYEKLQKKMAGFFTSDFVSKGLNGLINSFSLFIGVNENAEKELSAMQRTILDVIRIFAVMATAVISMSVLVATYNLLLKDSIAKKVALNAIEKTRLATTYLSTAAQTMYNTVLGLGQIALGKLTGSTILATLGQRNLNAAMAANPIGAVILLVTALSGALYILSQRQKEAKQAAKERYEETHRMQTMENEANEKGKIAADQYREKVDNLINTLKSKVATDEQRKKAYEALIRIHPEFMGTVDAEFRATAKLTQVYKDLAAQVDATARAKAKAAAKQSIYDQIEKDRITYVQGQSAREKEQEERNALRKQYSYSADRGNSAVNMFGSFEESNKGAEILNRIAANTKLITDLSNADQKRADAIQKALKTAQGNRKKVLEIELNSLLGFEDIPEETKSSYTVPGSDADKAGKAGDANKRQQQREAEKKQRAAEAHQREMEDAKKRGEDAKQLAVQIELDIEDAKIEAMQEGYDKEIDAIDLQQMRRNAQIDKQKVSEVEFEKIDEKIAKAEGDDKKLFEALKASWIANNTQLENLKLAEQAIYDNKRKALRVKSDNEFLKDQEENYQTEIGRVKRRRDEEIASLTTVEQMRTALQGRISAKEMRNIRTWQDGKEALTKLYQKEEFDLHVAHLQEMLSLYKGLDMTILNKDQQEQVLKFIEEAKNKIAELNAKKTETGNKENTGGGDTVKKLGGGSTDILGMSMDDWETFFTNIETGADKLGTMSAAIGLVKEAFAQYYAFVQAEEQAQLAKVDANAKKKEKRLKRMLDQGLLNQEQYDAEVERLNRETEMAKWKLEYDAAKRQRNYQIAQTIANTAMATMQAWVNPGYPMAIPLSIIIGALGTFQIATIAKQPLPEAPGFEDGYNFGDSYDMRREQDGKVFNVTRKKLKSGEVYRPTNFIAGENDKVEMVIANSDYKRFPPKLKSAIRSELALSRGYEGGYYPYLEKRNETDNSAELMAVIKDNTDAMNRVATMKPRAYLAKDMNTAKDILEITDEFSSYKKSSEK